jgi:hypothetical protein
MEHLCDVDDIFYGFGGHSGRETVVVPLLERVAQLRGGGTR